MGAVLGVVVSLIVGAVLAGVAAIGVVTAAAPADPEPISFDFESDYGTR